MLLSSPFGELNNIFQDEFNKILSQQSTNVRSCLSHNWIKQIKLKNKGKKCTLLGYVLEFLRKTT